MQSKLTVFADIEALGDKLTEAGKSALFRVAQEALTNVSKHSRAERVWITLKVLGASVHLTIEDDGIGGFQSQQNGGLGVANMQERLVSQGGELTLSALTSDGSGTRVIGVMPLSDPEAST